MLNIGFKDFERVSERLPYWTSAAHIHLFSYENFPFPLIFFEDQTIISADYKRKLSTPLKIENGKLKLDWIGLDWVDVSGDV